MVCDPLGRHLVSISHPCCRILEIVRLTVRTVYPVSREILWALGQGLGAYPRMQEMISVSAFVQF